MHFAVAVIAGGGKSVDELLAPYQENNMGDADKKYLEFFETGDEEDELDPETGKYGYWENPNAKWDWWVIGGRWRGQVRAIAGWRSPDLDAWTYIPTTAEYPSDRFDSATICDLNWCQANDLARKAEKEYDAMVLGKRVAGDDSPFWSPSRIKRISSNKEEYVFIESHMWWGSVITPDGQWHELGDLGIAPYDAPADTYYKWAKSFKERFVDPYPPDYTLTVVDCHI